MDEERKKETIEKMRQWGLLGHDIREKKRGMRRKLDAFYETRDLCNKLSGIKDIEINAIYRDRSHKLDEQIEELYDTIKKHLLDHVASNYLSYILILEEEKKE